MGESELILNDCGPAFLLIVNLVGLLIFVFQGGGAYWPIVVLNSFKNYVQTP